MKNRASFGGLLLVTIGLSGCGGDSAQAHTAVVRDSSGITIVENTAPAWPEGKGWRLSEEPVLSIGTLSGPEEYQLFRVAGAHRFADGRLAVANAGTHGIRFYDAEGRFLFATGRQGGGPGEFSWLARSWRRGDTLFAYDLMQQRMSVFDREGAFLRSFSLAGPEGGMPPRAIGRFPDGSWAAVRSNFAGVSGLVRDSAIYFRVSEANPMAEPLGCFLGAEHIVHPVAPGQPGFYYRHVPYGRVPSAAVLGGRLLYGSADRYEIGGTNWTAPWRG